MNEVEGQPRSNAIEAIIFDMDGVLVDSEPLWVEAETEVFASVGMQLTAELCAQTMGLRIDEAVRYWFERMPWTSKTCERIVTEVVESVAELVRLHAVPLPGIDHVVALAKRRHLQMAICSSLRLLRQNDRNPNRFR